MYVFKHFKSLGFLYGLPPKHCECVEGECCNFCHEYIFLGLNLVVIDLCKGSGGPPSGGRRGGHGGWGGNYLFTIFNSLCNES